MRSRVAAAIVLLLLPTRWRLLVNDGHRARCLDRTNRRFGWMGRLYGSGWRLVLCGRLTLRLVDMRWLRVVCH